jgi:predicted TIM-barrel fold metal-dependent hydrolase
MALDLKTIQVIDSDTHVTEPPDLWTLRMPAKWGDEIPRVEPHPASGEPCWRLGDLWLSPVAKSAMAGWREFPPGHPPTLEEADPASWDPVARLQRMDEYGIWAAVLYPNVLSFEARLFMGLDRDFSMDCIRAYNDFISDFAGVNKERLIPITMLPFWDQEAAVGEMIRCRNNGHRGVLFANRYERVGLPVFHDQYWDPILSTAQDLNMTINFHIAVAQYDNFATNTPMDTKGPQGHAVAALMNMLNNGETIAEIVTSGVCDRFPRLNWVSVESGFGFVPYLLENLDWHYVNYGARQQYPNSLLPSEYFRRQVFGSFWFEKGTLPLLEQYPDNFMFETDFPHPTSLSPGPASSADVPSVHISKALSGLSDQTIRKVLHDTAARLYLSN